MKNLHKSIKVIALIAVTFSFLNASSQSTWSTEGNNAESSHFLGTINNQPLRIMTDSVMRVTIGTNDTIQFKGTALSFPAECPARHSACHEAQL